MAKARSCFDVNFDYTKDLHIYIVVPLFLFFRLLANNPYFFQL